MPKIFYYLLLVITLNGVHITAIRFFNQLFQKRNSYDVCFAQLQPVQTCFRSLINDAKDVLRLAKIGKIEEAKILGKDVLRKFQDCAAAFSRNYANCCMENGDCSKFDDQFDRIAKEFRGEANAMEVEMKDATGLPMSNFIAI